MLAGVGVQVGRGHWRAGDARDAAAAVSNISYDAVHGDVPI